VEEAVEHGDDGEGVEVGAGQSLRPGPEVGGYKELDLPVHPSALDDEGRARYGITRKMPKSFDEAYTALRADGALKEALGSDVVRDYLTMKDCEQEMLDKMAEMERREWLIERY
jgi:glutamine synthetase